ncbi:conserved hypothetical protein [Candidatus Desulfarcum epimagneticum]|uniref:PIN domain-containing protein n=1 Tax=uncultured Desulfobacteraceae bacterium TaxID=218296 RepID=A0A484HJG2_9BACT|nr:conserved hypothetical protein [uncultured Desulfobacteraceae bacterium]
MLFKRWPYLIENVDSGEKGGMEKIYLDMNIYNRPYDDQSQARVKLETISVFEILSAMKSGRIHVAWSFILDYENSLNPYDDIRLEIESLAHFASEMIDADDTIRRFAKTYEIKGVKPRDALHIACAETWGAEHFVTCDDRLVKKQKALPIIVKLTNPIDFILHLEERKNAGYH